MTRFALIDRNCVVTGGGSGIGRGIALELARAGARIAVTGRREGPLRETVALVEERRGEARGEVRRRALCRTMDVAEPASVEDGFAELARELGEIHVLVNNAGVGGPNACSQEGPDRWQEIVRPNLDGVFYCSRAALRHMPDGGRVVNISSVLGKFGVPFHTAYCASKHGVIGLTKALALEVAARQITVNAICPGWVETDMARQGMENLGESLGVDFEEARRLALAGVPLGRILEPGEVGALCVYLASPEAGGVTAQAFSICGGQVMSG